MGEHRTKIETRKVTMTCSCGCGEMIHVRSVYSSDPKQIPQHIHRCIGCGEEATYTKVYPYLEYVEVMMFDP